MRKNSLNINIAAIAGLLGLATSVGAGTLTWSYDAPVVDGGDVANFVGSPNQAGNILAGDDAATFIAADRPDQGQTFLTTGKTGQILNAVTYQHVLGPDTWWSLDSGWTGYNGGRFQVSVGTIIDGLFVAKRIDTAYMNDTIPNAGSAAGIGTGMYATVTLDRPLALEPNTVYAIAWTSISDSNLQDAPYWEVNGSSNDNYADGEAFSLTGNQRDQNKTNFVNAQVGDRVFHVDITADEAVTWGPYEVRPDGYVDTGSFIGWCYVEQDPWIWSISLNGWVYLPGDSIGESGSWVYIPQ